MRKTLLFLSMAVMTLASLTSCEEKGEESEYTDWERKNDAFIDSIAKVAQTNADGTWTIIKAYTLGDSTALYNGQNDKFIYVKKLEKGTGTSHPLYCDSVRVHYYGCLIPSKTYPIGYNFEKSYQGDTLSAKTDVPTLFGVSNTKVGFATALQNMVVGDRWLVYIPYYLGYGTTDNSVIPAYSTLIFDMKLAKIYRKGIDTNTAWY